MHINCTLYFIIVLGSFTDFHYYIPSQTKLTLHLI